MRHSTSRSQVSRHETEQQEEAMRSDEARFWDERFRREGVIWGEEPSQTATTALRYLPANARVLEVGFGYGRDLSFLLRQGYRVWGIDLSEEAHRRADTRLRREELVAEKLETGSFGDSPYPDGLFDAVLCHRMAHLLVTDRAVERFADEVRRVLRPGGLLCLAVRNTEDLDPSRTRRMAENVYEYAPRPGHWIRFWDDDALRKAFGKDFTFLALDRACETESRGHPVPCHLTVMVGEKTRAVEADELIAAGPVQAGRERPSCLSGDRMYGVQP
jgi:SAM-dependent methyltransferase